MTVRVNPSTLIGIVASIVLLGIVLIFSAQDASLFVDLPGLGIVLVGTAAATFIAYPLREVTRIFGSIRNVLHSERLPIDQDLEDLSEIARIWMQSDIHAVEKVLEKLERWMPEQFKLAEVVGKWVWITFPEPPAERVRAELSQLGFHWNNTRKCWQHPCGATLPRGTQEPRTKYEVWFPMDAARRKAKAQESLVQAAA